MISRNPVSQEIIFTTDEIDEIKQALREIFANTEAGRVYKTSFYSRETADEDLEKILRAAQLVAGGPNVSVSSMTRGLELLIDSGEIRPKNFAAATPLEEPQEDARPRDRNGKLLTEPQLKWKSFREWSESHSAEECRQRARVDADFGSFMRKNLRREMAQEIGDAVVPEGQSKLPRIEATSEIANFARAYKAEPIANLKPKAGFVRLAGEQLSWTRFNELLTKATELHLV